MAGRKKQKNLLSFDFEPGTVVAGKYEIMAKLGSGWEGEVYHVCERSIGIERAAKFFFPQRNHRNRTTKFYARKLHRLRHCPILIQYHTQERIMYRGVPVTFLVSEFVEGELLQQFLKRLPGKRLTPFEGLHLLHKLAEGVEAIHQSREYHGDLHDDNVIIRRQGLSFYVKLVDMYNWGTPCADNIREDVCDLIRIFYDALGGARHYSKLPPEIKSIICGLKRTLIVKKFRTAGRLRKYLETMSWSSM
jgi:serine/threonine protein kinase